MLYLWEHIRLVHFLIETVTYYDETNQIEIRFRLTQDTRQIDVASNSD